MQEITMQVKRGSQRGGKATMPGDLFAGESEEDEEANEGGKSSERASERGLLREKEEEQWHVERGA